MRYSETISRDFEDMYNLLIKKTEGKMSVFRENVELLRMLELYHQKMFILKDIIKGSLKYEDMIYDKINFIWLLYIADYSSAISNYRNGLDKFARDLITSLDSSCMTDSFSNNIEKSLSLFRKSKDFGSKKNKEHKKFMNEKLGDLIKKHYYELSDIIHGKKKIVFGVSSYLEDILNHQKKQNVTLSLEILKLVNNNIRLVCILILIVDKERVLYHNNTLKYEKWKEILGEEIVEYNLKFEN